MYYTNIYIYIFIMNNIHQVYSPYTESKIIEYHGKLLYS